MFKTATQKSHKNCYFEVTQNGAVFAGHSWAASCSQFHSDATNRYVSQRAFAAAAYTWLRAVNSQYHIMLLAVNFHRILEYMRNLNVHQKNWNLTVERAEDIGAHFKLNTVWVVFWPNVRLRTTYAKCSDTNKIRTRSSRFCANVNAILKYVDVWKTKTSQMMCIKQRQAEECHIVMQRSEPGAMQNSTIGRAKTLDDNIGNSSRTKNCFKPSSDGHG